jgi:hypothetical protein
MDVESPHDDVRLTLPRAQAEALLAAADDGLKVILALEMVKATGKLENAVRKLGKALQARAAMVSADFDRVEAAGLNRAADVGIRLHDPFGLTWDPTLARSALDKLRFAIGAA